MTTLLSPRWLDAFARVYEEVVAVRGPSKLPLAARALEPVRLRREDGDCDCLSGMWFLSVDGRPVNHGIRVEGHGLHVTVESWRHAGTVRRVKVHCFGEPDEVLIRWVAAAVELLPGGGS
jgi:hypothetical protein